MFDIVHKVQQTKISFSGKLLYKFLPQRRKNILNANINKVYPSISSEQKANFRLAITSHLAKFIVENIVLSHLPKRSLINKFEVTGRQYLQGALSKGRGVIVLTGHLGQFESSLMVFQMLSQSKIISSAQWYCIRRPIKNLLLNRILLKRSEKYGLKVIPSKGAIKQIAQKVDGGSILAFPFDQRAQIRGIWSDFLGLPALTYSTLAELVFRKQFSVVPLNLYRREDGIHAIEFLPEVIHKQAREKDAFIALNTNLYNQILEQMVLSHPEQWYCWVHDRWKKTKKL